LPVIQAFSSKDSVVNYYGYRLLLYYLSYNTENYSRQENVLFHTSRPRGMTPPPNNNNNKNGPATNKVSAHKSNDWKRDRILPYEDTRMKSFDFVHMALLLHMIPTDLT
jgi:hypothetical protein